MVLGGHGDTMVPALGYCTVNGIPADLTGEQFDVALTYSKVTPYLGIGWGHNANADRGLGFFADLGAQFGHVSTQVTTTVVGKFGITQADVDAEAASVRDYANKFSVLPTLNVGISYKF